MGPSPLSDGDFAFTSRFVWMRWLQWGRRLSATETGNDEGRDQAAPAASMGPSPLSDGDSELLALVNPIAALQWGRRLSATETARHHPGPRRGRGFNGAVASQRRRP